MHLRWNGNSNLTRTDLWIPYRIRSHKLFELQAKISPRRALDMFVPKPNALIKSRSLDVVRHDPQENTVNLRRTGMLDHGADELASPSRARGTQGVC